MKLGLKIAVIALLAVSFAIPAFAQKAGETIYKEKCAMCHGPDGQASTMAGKMLKAIPFKSPELVKKSDAALIAATKNGKGKMPEFGTKLSNSQIKEVVEYIRTLQKKK